MLDEDTITQQLALLATHRRTLGALLHQLALLGGVAYATPGVLNSIEEARANIAGIKATLRERGVTVADEPNDEKPPQPAPIVPQQSGSGDQITVGAIVGSTAVAIGAGAQATATIYQMPKLDPVLHQLRAPVSDFVGREREIDKLVQALTGTSGGATAISGVRGMGGIGKSELAYVVANQVTDAFPDAQLLVELRGASNKPMTPEQALQTVIRAFEREATLPDDLNQLQSIYRSMLTGRKTLILVDDARDVDHVRPLLPPPGCALLVTSRNWFNLPGMTVVDLGILPPEEAEKLLVEICPRIGIRAPELARLCGYLPLALRVSAGVLTVNDIRPVPRYLEQLTQERLKHLSDPDNPNEPQASVQASLQLSYYALEPEARQVLCQLSVFPASFDVSAAVAVVAVEGSIEERLEQLRRRSLLEWDMAAERFGLHDLVRVFAGDRLANADVVRLRHARHYITVANRAQELYLQGGHHSLAGLALFDRERAHIDVGWGCARERAGDPEADKLLLAYADGTVYVGSLRYDRRRERIPQLEAALEAAQRRGDRQGEGTVLGSLGNAYFALGDARRTISFQEKRLEIAREFGDRRGQGQALGNLGVAFAALGDARTAITYYEQVLAITREISDRRTEGAALGNLGAAYARLGDIRRAITYYEQVLAIANEMGDRRGQGQALGNLGSAYVILGDVHRAITCYEQHLAVAREIGDQSSEGQALGNLGVAYGKLGDTRRAIRYYRLDLAITREIGDRRGEATVSWNLGLAYEQQGELARAAELMHVCVGFEREIGHPDAEKRASYLERLCQRLAASQNAPTADHTDEG